MSDIQFIVALALLALAVIWIRGSALYGHARSGIVPDRPLPCSWCGEKPEAEGCALWCADCYARLQARLSQISKDSSRCAYCLALLAPESNTYECEKSPNGRHQTARMVVRNS